MTSEMNKCRDVVAQIESKKKQLNTNLNVELRASIRRLMTWKLGLSLGCPNSYHEQDSSIIQPDEDDALVFSGSSKMDDQDVATANRDDLEGLNQAEVVSHSLPPIES
ncbi:hypothetical protein U1Q18_002952 [Sarracenia purpurea var. burkii]